MLMVETAVQFSLFEGFPGGSSSEEPPLPLQGADSMQVLSLGQEDPLEEGRATHSTILAWRIPWTEEPGRGHSPLSLKELDMTEVT